VRGPSGSEKVIHAIEPVWDAESRVLVLGTMPSPASREAGFYYGHPQNRFWPVLAALFNASEPQSTDQRRAFVLGRHIALWDVLASCEIRGAEDSTIRNPVPNDIAGLLAKAPNIRRVFTTGQVAHSLYDRLIRPLSGMADAALPSPSPANRGRYPMARLLESWAPLREALE